MRSPRRTPRTPWHLPQFTTKNPRATKQQTTQFPWRRPQSIPDRTRRIPCTCLYFWSIERVRHLPNVVCYTPTATPACIDDILDWFLTILGILLLRMFFINFLHTSIIHNSFFIQSLGCYHRTFVWYTWSNLVNDCRDSLLFYKHVDDQSLRGILPIHLIARCIVWVGCWPSVRFIFRRFINPSPV